MTAMCSVAVFVTRVVPAAVDAQAPSDSAAAGEDFWSAAQRIAKEGWGWLIHGRGRENIPGDWCMFACVAILFGLLLGGIMACIVRCCRCCGARRAASNQNEPYGQRSPQPGVPPSADNAEVGQPPNDPSAAHSAADEEGQMASLEQGPHAAPSATETSCTVCRVLLKAAGGDGPRLELTTLKKTDWNYMLVAALLATSVPQATDIEVQIVQNNAIERQYDVRKCGMRGTDGSPPEERYLWHGSSSTRPWQIYSTAKGFMTNFSEAGLWGSGLYFSTEAKYSDRGYAHCVGNRRRQLLLAEVAVGRSVRLASDRSLKVPPALPAELCNPDNGPATERYDSVNGITQGTLVYIIYDGDQAYPRYLVEYSVP
eukprot:TRINITY_DN9528_c0_g1_i2.p1 TRINITY_DN9528_c0_g1~~TRINITY_DN9528_c0_g1_i2.p1  ORF type:complete len:394 (+),score=85.49 TRINITY_DN9528_c0_g1_i2:74-1183(+)